MMHGNRHISAFRKLWLAVMAFAALSCNEDVIGIMTGGQTSGPEFSPTSEVTVEFNILNPDAAPDTRVDDPQEWTDLDGTSAENKINNIYLFAVDYDTETGEETVEEVVKADLVPGDFTPAGVRTGHTFKLSSGTKRFYVGANMTEAHVQAFRNKTAMRADSYDSALAMVMDNYDNKTGEGTNILMFSAPAKDASDKTDIDITTSRFISITSKLKRLVSKVMVVADYDGQLNNTGWLAEMGRSEAIPYIKYIKDGETIGYFFDMQFILNTTNKALSIQETRLSPTDLFNTDSNWKIGDWVIDDPGYGIMIRPMSGYNENFCSWSDEHLKTRLASKDTWYCSDVPSRSSGYHGQGLYCLENTVYDPDASTFADADKKEKAAYLTTTHIYLKMRFVPEKICGQYSDNGPGAEVGKRIYDLYYMKDSEGNNPYTFYIYNGDPAYKYFTWSGVQRWIDEKGVSKSDFTEYTGGWVYFKTFFEEGGKDDGDNNISHKDLSQWGIRRNDYCILTINGFVSEGELDPGEAYIKVKSETVPWNKKGSSDVTVTPE